MSHKKFGPDRFSRFDVYWIQTNKQTNKQTDKLNLYIDVLDKTLQFRSVTKHTWGHVSCKKKDHLGSIISVVMLFIGYLQTIKQAIFDMRTDRGAGLPAGKERRPSVKRIAAKD